LFHSVFDEIALLHPDIQNEHMIIDIGAARLADTPEMFDVIVTPNLYGDIVSDIAAQIAGSVGMAPSANIGDHGAMFEAIHGSAPDLAGQNVANPSGLLLAAVQMLVHLGQPSIAEKVHNAWLRTIEDGIHTFDIYTEGSSHQCLGTKEFAESVIVRLGQIPHILAPVKYHEAEQKITIVPYQRPPALSKDLVGVDVFLHWREKDPTVLAQFLQAAQETDLPLTMVTNRGVKVWPEGLAETFCTDHWRCRFLSPLSVHKISHAQILGLLTRISEAGLDFIKCENLCNFDGQPGFALGQGQ